MDLFATLSGGHFFSTLGLCNAYHQMEVEELTINTHKVLYRYLRLPFGVASAPSLFQKSLVWNKFCRTSRAWSSTWMICK